MDVGTAVRVIGPDDGERLGPPDGVTDRFVLPGEETGGRFTVVEHVLAVGALAAPMHLHTREDEYSYVLAGTVGAVLGGTEVVAGPGDLVVKPRDQWHTFWNAGDAPARVLELISPAGLERLFREMGLMDAPPEPDQLAELADRFGCRVDFPATGEVLERHGLRF